MHPTTLDVTYLMQGFYQLKWYKVGSQQRDKTAYSRLSVEQQQLFYYFQGLLIDFSNLVNFQHPKFWPS